MPIKLGTDNVSRNQRDYLELAKRSSANRRATYLARIITDDDIQSGREMVHPDWIDIYRSTRKDLLGLPLPESLINKIIKTFDEVSCFDDVSAVNPKTMHLAFLLGQVHQSLNLPASLRLKNFCLIYWSALEDLIGPIFKDSQIFVRIQE